MSGKLFITQEHMGKTYIVNKKQFRVCPDHLTGNAVLVSRRGITIEVLVLRAERCLISDKSKTPSYIYNDGHSYLYSKYAPKDRELFDYYEKFFE